MKLYLVRHGQSTGNIAGTLMGQSDHPLTPLGEDQARAAAERLAPFGPMPVYASDLPRAQATAQHIVARWRAAGATDVPRVVLDPRLREIALGDYEGRPWQEFEADVELTAAFAADPYGTALPNGESLEHLEARAHAVVVEILAAFGMDDTGALRGDAARADDADAVDRTADAMRAGAAAAALDGASAEEMAAALGGAPVEEVEHDAPGTTADRPVKTDAGVCLVAHDGPIRAILNHYLGVPPEKWWTLSTTHGGVSLIEFGGGWVSIRYINATGHLVGLEPDRYVPSDD